MIVERESSDSEVDDYLRHTKDQTSGGDGLSLTPTRHVGRFIPLVLSEVESSEDDGEGEHLQLPVRLRSRRTTEAAVRWRSRAWESIDTSDCEEEYRNTPYQNKQLYLLVARCIAYSFNAKFQVDTAPPKPRLSNEGYLNTCDVLTSAINQDKSLQREVDFLTSNEIKCMNNTEFLQSVEWYFNNIYTREDVRLACVTGGFSIKELEHIFRVAICRKFREKFTTDDMTASVKSNKKIELDPKFQIWVSTFVKMLEHGSQSAMSEKELRQINDKQMNSFEKDQLYPVLQSILGIARNEHQALFRACNLNSNEEQEDVVRRELNRRKELLKKGECSFYWKNQLPHVQEQYFEEMNRHLRQLTENLEKHSMTSSEYGVTNKKKKHVSTDIPSEATFSKNDFLFHHKVKVTVRDTSHLIGVQEKKHIFIIFELDGNNPLATNSVPVSSKHIAVFEEGGEFWTNSPLPQLRFTLKMETQGLLNNEKLLAKKVHTVMPTPIEVTETIQLQKNEGGTVVGHLRVAIFLERPSNMRKCGYLFCSGDFIFKQWKSRFLALLQMSQFHFVLCSYQPKDTHPREFILLQGLTVDFVTNDDSEDEKAYLFSLSSERGVVKFGCATHSERDQWVQWLTRATGQTDKPLGQKEQPNKAVQTGNLEALGIADVVTMDVSQLDHPRLFTKLFKLILNYRLNEIDFSRGFFSPSQMFIIDEYCARYCIRLSHRHLTCLWEWLQCELRGQRIWPVMMLHSFGFCQMHVLGQKPQEHSEVVTPEEKQQWFQLSGQIELLLAEKLENFRESFPFSCPKDDLKITMKLFTLVAEINHSKDSKHKMPLYSEDRPMHLLVSVLERAALNNYKKVFTKLWQYEELSMNESAEYLTVEQLYVLAQGCVDFMYELHEFYADDFTLYPLALIAHIDAFWSFFVVDLQECLRISDVSIISLLKMFYSLNEYFCSQPTLKLSKFHQTLLLEFQPLVDRYLDDLDVNIKRDLLLFLQNESWLPVTECCYSMQGCLEALESIKTFVEQLNWPQDPYATELVTKVQAICADKFEIVVNFTRDQCASELKDFIMNYTTLLPKRTITMVNTIMFLSVQAAPFCGLSGSNTVQIPEEQLTIAVGMTSSLESSIDVILSSVIDKLCEPFNDILTQLTKYDPSGGLFSSLRKIVPGLVQVEPYNNYVQNNLQHLSRTLVSAAFTSFALNWYETQLRMLNRWLKQRPVFSLNETQQESIQTLIQDIRQLFLEEELEEEQLDTENFEQIEDRLRKEASQAALTFMN